MFYMNILVIFLSLGIVMRGVLYYIVSVKPMNSKFNYLSITKSASLKNSISNTENPQEYADNNKIAGKAYFYLGLILFFMYLVIVFLFPSFFRKHYLVYFFSIFILDYLINIVISIKLKINEWEKNNLIKK